MDDNATREGLLSPARLPAELLLVIARQLPLADLARLRATDRGIRAALLDVWIRKAAVGRIERAWLRAKAAREDAIARYSQGYEDDDRACYGCARFREIYDTHSLLHVLVYTHRWYEREEQDYELFCYRCFAYSMFAAQRLWGALPQKGADPDMFRHDVRSNEPGMPLALRRALRFPIVYRCEWQSTLGTPAPTLADYLPPDFNNVNHQA